MSEVAASYEAVCDDAPLVGGRPVGGRPVGGRPVAARTPASRSAGRRSGPAPERGDQERGDQVRAGAQSGRGATPRPRRTARRARRASDGSVRASDAAVAREDGGAYVPDLAIYAALDQAVAEVVGTDLDAMDEALLLEHLDRLARPIAKLQAARSRCMAAVEHRRVVSAPHHQRPATRRETRGEMARKQRLTPSDAKRASEAGRAAADHPRTGQVFRDGELSEAHVRLIAGVLDQLPPDRATAIEPTLLELASTRDAVAFGREARRVLADEDVERAAELEQRRHGRRGLRITDTDDGGLVFRGEMHGLAAETARAALRAFRRPDTPDEHRRPEQREADAFEQVCASALRSLDAPSEHGTRPQVIVIMQADQLGRPIGTARFALSGQPVTTAELAPILTDCAIGRLVVDAKGTPLEASVMVRDVPAGLWRALVVRDGGCTWDGCDAPASWCDVAHGEHPYRRKGRLSPANATLLCRRHHRRFDQGNYRVTIDGEQVTFHRRTSTDVPTDSPATVNPPGVADQPRLATAADRPRSAERSGSQTAGRGDPLATATAAAAAGAAAAPLRRLDPTTATSPPDIASGRPPDPTSSSGGSTASPEPPPATMSPTLPLPP